MSETESPRETQPGSGTTPAAGGARATRNRASRLPYVVATLFMGLVVVAAWVGRDRFRPVMAGEPAPAFEVADLQGEPVALDDYRGKVVLVNIWATWCAPCREEMPSMERLYRELDDEDFEILAVSVDAAPGETDTRGNPGASKQKLAEFAAEYELTFPILHDPSGKIQGVYQTTGVPESFLVDRDGVIVKRIAGATIWDHENYRTLVSRLLADG